MEISVPCRLLTVRGRGYHRHVPAKARRILPDLAGKKGSRAHDTDFFFIGMISLWLMWVILKKKNHKFNDGILSFIELKTLFVRLFEWARTFGTRCMFCCRVY